MTIESRLRRLEQAGGRCPTCGNPGPPPSLVATPEWRAVVGVLTRHPEVSQEVSRALAALEQEARP